MRHVANDPGIYPMGVNEAAQLAYDAYRTKAGGRSLATGQPLPEWPRLSQEIRDAWCAAAEAVLAWSHDWCDEDTTG